MARSQQAVYLQTYLTDAITEEVLKHGRHNQKLHGRRGKGGAPRDLSSKDYSAQGKYGMTGLFRVNNYTGQITHAQVNLDKRERASRAAVGAGAAVVAGGLMTSAFITGNEAASLAGAVATVEAVRILSQAVRGKGWAKMNSERGRRATNPPESTQKAAGPKANPKALATLQSAYRRWLTATGRDDSDESAEAYSRLVLAEAQRRKGK